MFKWLINSKIRVSVIIFLIAIAWQYLDDFVVERFPDPRVPTLLSNLLLSALLGILLFVLLSMREKAIEALRQREQDYRNLVEFLPDMVLLSRNDQIIDINQAGIRILGAAAAEQLVGKSLFDIIHPDYHSIVRQRIQDLQDGKPTNPLLEEKYIRLDGKTIDVEVTATSLVYQNQSTELVLVRDISERKQAEQKLVFQAHMLANIREAVLGSDEESILTFWNAAAESIYGWKEEEVIGKSESEILQNEFPDGNRDKVFQELRESGEYTGKVTQIRKDGTKIFVEMHANTVHDPNGKTIGFVSVYRDITLRKQRLEKLAEQAHLLDLSNAVACNMRDEIILWTSGMEKLYGWSSEEVLGRVTHDLFQTIHPKPYEEIHAALMRNGQWDGELIHSKKDGTKITVSSHWELQRDASGNPIAILESNNDITELEQAQEALRESGEKLKAAQKLGRIGNWEYDLESQKITWSDQIYTIYERDPLKGPPSTEEEAAYYSLEQRQALSEYTKIAITTSQDFEYDLQANLPSGNQKQLAARVQPIKDAQGQVIQLNGIVQDITERKQAEQRIESQMQRLEALRTIDAAISGSLDLRTILNIIGEQTITQLGMDAVSVLLFNTHTQMLCYASGQGFHSRAIEQSRVRFGEGPVGKAFLERNMITVHNPIQSPDFTRATLLAGEGFVEYYGAPMIAKGHIVGVLEVFSCTSHETDEKWRNFLETLAGQAAIAVDNTRLFQDLQVSNVNLHFAYDATIEGWSRALDLRDQETEGHSTRVAELTLKLASMAGMTEEELVHVRRGALLHDIGKMGVPDSILLKPDKLTDSEWKIMRTHPQLAFEMLAPIAFLRPALDIPGCHHEKWDGSGYPRGLKGEQIPLAARLFAVVEVWDALRSDRPYRKAWPEEKVLEHIRLLAGTHFDPKAVEYFLKMIKEYMKGVD
jgi:PAS domain S-box-containing protein/putative nucleotidyltransferase with HDIG domain